MVVVYGERGKEKDEAREEKVNIAMRISWRRCSSAQVLEGRHEWNTKGRNDQGPASVLKRLLRKNARC